MYRNYIFFLLPLQPNAGYGLLIHEVFSRSHTTDTTQSVGILWTNDQLVAETSTLQHTTLKTDLLAPGGIRNHDLSRRATTDLRRRPMEIE